MCGGGGGCLKRGREMLINDLVIRDFNVRLKVEKERIQIL